MKPWSAAAIGIAVALTAPAAAAGTLEEDYAAVLEVGRKLQEARQDRDEAAMEAAMEELYSACDAFLGAHMERASGDQLLQAGLAYLQLGFKAERYDALEARIAELRALDPLPADLERAIAAIEAKMRIRPGEPAPEWTLTDVATGEPLALDDLAGKVVLLDFWATWCGSCVRLMREHLLELHEMYGERDDFALVGVGVPWKGDTAAKQHEFAENNGFHWRKVFDADGEAAMAYGVDAGLPFLCLIDEGGTILLAGAGTSEIDEIKAALGERFPRGE